MIDREFLAYSNRKIIQAGKVLRGTIRDDADSLEHAKEVFRIAYAWRAAHYAPMRWLRSELQSKISSLKIDGITAARLKRMPSLRAKLRNAPNDLYQMQDIGGCRAIVSDMDEVRRLLKRYTERPLHEHRNGNDYIQEPKEDGYRGVHLIFRCRGKLGDADRVALNSKAILIEIQLRTRLQHAWATAVEAVGAILREDLKGGKGNPAWLRLFALVSSEMAEAEACPLVPSTPANADERRREIRDLDAKLNALNSLDQVRIAVKAVSSVRLRNSPSYIVSLDAANRSVSVQALTAGTPSESYRTAENLTGRNSVLVDLERAEDLRAAYPNYFLDVGAFTDFVRHSIGAVSRPQTQLSRDAKLLDFLRRPLGKQA